MIPAPSLAVREYFHASGSIAVYLYTDKRGIVRLRRASDPWDKVGNNGEIWFIRWVFGRKAARDAMGILKDFESDESLDLGERERWQRAVTRGEPEIVGAPHDNALRIAERAVAIVEGEYAAMKGRGELRDMNAKYREDRLKAEAEGKPHPSWSEVEENHRLMMVRLAAGQVAEHRRAAGAGA